MPLLNTRKNNLLTSRSLYGAGNSSISDDEIRQYIHTPGRTLEEIRNQAARSGVSQNQINSAMAGNPDYTQAKTENYLSSTGIRKPGKTPGMTTSQQQNILYGAGNDTISGEQIRSFINQPGKTPQQIHAEALRQGISTKQINDAMRDDPRYAGGAVEKYLSEQGINNPNPSTTGGGVLAERVKTPGNVKPTAIQVGVNETVQGRMDSLLRDPNNPLNVQAQTFGNQQANRRGLLNSSIGISAAQDAMYKNALPIATQDAATYYDALKTNSGQDLTAGMFNTEMGAKIGMFNSELGSKVGMFNSDQKSRESMFDKQLSHDWSIAEKKNFLDKYVADMDNGTKTAIANLELLATETNQMGEMSRGLMDLYVQTATNDKIPQTTKDSIFATLKGIQEDFGSYMVSFEKAGKNLVFSPSTVASGAASAGGGTDTGKKTEGANTTANGSTILGAPVPESSYVDTRSDGAVAVPGFQGKADGFGAVKPNAKGDGYTLFIPSGTPNNAKSVAIDTSSFQLSPQEKVGIQSYNAMHGLQIAESDIIPQAFIDNPGPMMNYYKQHWAVPVQPPGTMRADSPSYYVWAAAAPKYRPK